MTRRVVGVSVGSVPMRVVEIEALPHTPAVIPAPDQQGHATQSARLPHMGDIGNMHISGTRPTARLRQLVTAHPAALSLWFIATTLILTSIVLDSSRIGRAGFLVALVAVVISVRDLAQHIVTRVTGIVALWEEDVELDDAEPPDFCIDLSRARYRREERRRERRIVP